MTGNDAIDVPFMRSLGESDARFAFERFFDGSASSEQSIDLAFQAASSAATRFAGAGIGLFFRVAYLNAFKNELKRQVAINHNREGAV